MSTATERVLSMPDYWLKTGYFPPLATKMGRLTTTKSGEPNRIAENGMPKKHDAKKKGILNHNRKREAKYQ